MKRLALLLPGARPMVAEHTGRVVLLLSLLAATTAAASELGPDGRLRFSPNALATYGFEDSAAAAAFLRHVALSADHSTWAYNPLTADQVDAYTVRGLDRVEGSAALRWVNNDGYGLAIIDPTLFASVANRRISVNVWGRAEGVEPFLTVTYGNAADVPTHAPYAWARVPAVRTGRETTDGWVEYATGPIDGSVFGRPLHDIILSGRMPSVTDGTVLRLIAAVVHPNDAASFDAVEVLPEPGPIQSAACTLLTVDSDCGTVGECMYGRCVDSAVVWEPVPPLALQKEIVGRFVSQTTGFLGNRGAVQRADPAWVASTLALASATATPKTFWAGLNRQSVALKDGHTRFGTVFPGITTAFTLRPDGSGGVFDACFGPTENDLGDGGMTYVLWSKGAAAAASTKVGDVVTAIDGKDPAIWAQAALERYESTLPNERAAVWGTGGFDLGWLIGTHAKTLSLSRCTGGVCTAQPDLDVATFAASTLQNGNYGYDPTSFCVPRFSSPVAATHVDSSFNDIVASAELDGGVLALEFDGFINYGPGWTTTVDAAFAKPHDRIVIDAREGHGGSLYSTRYFFQQLRSSNDAVAMVSVGRGSYTNVDEPWLTSFPWSTCVVTGSSVPFECASANLDTYTLNLAAAPAMSSRVALLGTDDISGNDFLARMLKGRDDLMIFSPLPTSGSFGAVAVMPQLLPSWSPGGLPYEDSHYGTSANDCETVTAFESDHGVQPDVVVTQKLSDVLIGRDTILSAAMTWVLQ